MTEEWESMTIPVRRPLVDQVIQNLTELIEREGLQPGDRLPTEARLAARLGVGRSTVREAIRVLSHAGLLQTRQGSGNYVAAARGRIELDARLADARVSQVFEVRRALETLIAQAAPTRRTDQHIFRMREALNDCRTHADNGDIAAFVAADTQFHLTAAEATGNAVLVELYTVLRRSLEDANFTIADLVELQHANDLHAVLLEAIVQRDPAAAEAATREHLADTIQHFESARDQAIP